MSGMDMLFKSMGLDPEAMQKSAAEFKGAVVAMNDDLQFIKSQNAKILELLTTHSPETPEPGTDNVG